jgi:hypothetical protein
MLKYKNSYLILALTAFLFQASCIDYDYESPEKESYSVDFEANTTIQELKAVYGDSLTKITDDIIIKGTVVADDATGNYYKTIVLQDSSGAIAVTLDAYELHNLYGIGDLIYIKCQGLYLGEYGGVVQLGSDYNGQVGRIEEPLIKEYLYKSDGGEPIEPEVITFNQFTTDRINTVIKLENVQFKAYEIGGTFSDGINQIDYSRILENCEGIGVEVRTSGYCDFANDTVPAGNGSFTGILGYHLGSYQLTIRNPDELDMQGPRCGPIFSEDFENDLGFFTAYNLVGETNTWVQDIFSGTTFAKMTGYYSGSNEESEDWLISHPIDLTIAETPLLSFKHAVNYGYTGWQNDVKIMVSTDYTGGNPTENGSWTELTGFDFPAGNNWTFIESGAVDISAYKQSENFRFAFVYTSPTDDAVTWEIDWVKIENAN